MTKRRDRERARDQLGLTLLLWFIPVCLFGYLAWEVAEATGNDPKAYLPPVDPWQLALLVAGAVAMVAALVAWRASGRGASDRADDSHRHTA